MLGGKNGTVYFSRYSTNSTYAYHVAEHIFTQEEFEKSGYRYDLAVVRVKLDGTGFKILKKYYMP